MSPTQNENMIAEQKFFGQTFSHVEEGAVYMNCVFRDTRWIDVNLQHVRFINCHFENMFCFAMRATNTHWDECEMHHMEWQKVDIQQSHIINSVLTDWHMDSSQLMHFGLTNVNVSNWHLTDCQMQHLTWVGCNVQFFSLMICRAMDVSWIDSKITEARLEGCKIERFITAQADIFGLSLIACTGSQVRITQGKVSTAIYKDNDIDGASWSHSELKNCQFIDSKFPLAGFDNASLNCVSFERIEMSRVLFDGATLQASHFNQVQAPNASFRSAHMSVVTFSQTNLSELDARGLKVDFLKLLNVDCQRANLIGQDPQIWRAAQLKDARFEESKDLDDLAWWLTTRPGHRVALS